MALSPLLKYFIDVAISYKEFSTISQEMADALYLEDENEEHFHLEYIENNLCQVWRQKEWQESVERRERIKEISARERAIWNEKSEKRNAARKRLLNIMSEKEADEILFKIIEKSELPELRAKLKL